jgi:hypothetical protein
MAIELYVDSLNKAQTLGITSNNLSVAYNLELLKNFNPEASSVFTAGRYFCIVWETSPPSITFVDIFKNPDVLETIVYAPEISKQFREKFNSQLEMYNANYELKKAEVKLIGGVAPVTVRAGLKQLLNPPQPARRKLGFKREDEQS